MVRPRILLADDHPGLQAVLREVLSEMGEVVGTVADGQLLVETAQRLKPDIIVTDISMPRMNGLEATRALQVCLPQSRVIILTSHQEPAFVTAAFTAGARGYVLKQTAFYAELSQALLHVLAGDRYVGMGVREEQELGDSAVTAGPARTERSSIC